MGDMYTPVTAVCCISVKFVIMNSFKRLNTNGID